MKKKALGMLFALIILITPLTTFANQQVKLEINGNSVTSEVAPFIENGRTMVPLRLISETLGYAVSWDEVNQVVTIAGGTEQNPVLLALVIGESKVIVFDSQSIIKSQSMTKSKGYTLEEASNQLYENVKVNGIETAPKVINSRTFVPIRVIAENFGAKVEWNQSTWTAKINTNDTVYEDPVTITINGKAKTFEGSLAEYNSLKELSEEKFEVIYENENSSSGSLSGFGW